MIASANFSMLVYLTSTPCNVPPTKYIGILWESLFATRTHKFSSLIANRYIINVSPSVGVVRIDSVANGSFKFWRAYSASRFHLKSFFDTNVLYINILVFQITHMRRF